MPRRKMLAEQPGFKYTGHDDFYGYQRLDKRDPASCYYIEGRDGSMLLGDGLPMTEEDAKKYCRCANIAYEQGLENFEKALKEAMKQIGCDFWM